MDFLIELLLRFLFEIALQIASEIVFALGWESLKASVRKERQGTALLAGLGHFLMGLFAGFLSLFMFGRLTRPATIPGMSLILGPLATGIAMHWLGEWRVSEGKDRPALFTFQGGAIFAFGMALMRFWYLRPR